MYDVIDVNRMSKWLYGWELCEDCRGWGELMSAFRKWGELVGVDRIHFVRDLRVGEVRKEVMVMP